MPTYKNRNPVDRQFSNGIDSFFNHKNVKNGVKTAKMLEIFQIFLLKSVKMRVKTRILSTFLRIQETWSSVRETGRFGLYQGDSRIIRESWHLCNYHINIKWTAFILATICFREILYRNCWQIYPSSRLLITFVSMSRQPIIVWEWMNIFVQVVRFDQHLFTILKSRTRSLPLPT